MNMERYSTMRMATKRLRVKIALPTNGWRPLTKERVTRRSEWRRNDIRVKIAATPNGWRPLTNMERYSTMRMATKRLRVKIALPTNGWRTLTKEKTLLDNASGDGTKYVVI